MGNLTDIADRLTPSVPIEITFGAQPLALGKKFTTMFAHKASSGSTAPDYSVYTVVNVGDPAAAKAEVDAIAGSGSQAGKMAYAFVAANGLAGRGNFPAFRICFLPFSEIHFGPSAEGITAVQGLRTDMFVSPYPAEDTTNKTTLLNLCILISGIDRDLQGQFGSFMTLGSIASLATQEALAYNSRYIVIAALPDSNTALVVVTGDTHNTTNVIDNITSTVGIYPGAVVTGTGIPANTVVQQVFAHSVTVSNPSTSDNTAESINFQNVVSQASEIVAAAHAATMMSFQLPYIPLEGVTLGGIVPPQKPSDRVQIDPNGTSEAALTAGLSPMYLQPGGTMGLIRTVTTFTTLPGPGSIRATAYFDWQDLVILNDFREICFQVTQNPPFNNNPGGTKASKTIAALLKDEIFREALAFEELGAFQGVKTNAKLFLVQPSTTSRGRFDFKIPVNVVPGLMVIAGNIQGVSGADFGDFTL